MALPAGRELASAQGGMRFGIMLPSSRRVPFAFPRDGIALKGVALGAGRPALFMHGLGGSVAQAEQLVGAISGTRWLLPDSRGHGESPAGASRPFSVPLLAADALAFAEALGERGVVAGGISLGAAMALHLAVRHPRAVRALVLVRPAWLFAPAPRSLAAYPVLAAALRAGSAEDGRRGLLADPAFKAAAARSPSHAAALLRWFDHPDPAAAADLIEGVVIGDPGVTRNDVARIQVPALVVAAEGEEAHPVITAHLLADTLPRARLVTVPPRGTDKPAFLAAMQGAIAAFLAGLPAEPSGTHGLQPAQPTR